MQQQRLKNGYILEEKYEIVTQIHKGRGNAIYGCKDIESGEQRVVKEFWCGNLPEEEKNISKLRFDREIQILRSLRHKGIPYFYDSFTEGIWYYMVVEYVRGKSLKQIKKERAGPIEAWEVASWGSQVCDILYFLHNRGAPIIFRDLKPSHIMLTDEGAIKLIDFGLARLFLPSKERDTIVQGSLGYAAPEQYGEKQTDPRSDIYSLGVTLYELLTGADVHRYIFDFPPIRQLNRDIPAWFAAIVTRALQKHPEDRYRDVLMLQQELEEGLKKTKAH